jgi:Raf kinase inhibitor-like YbhB/YbcL family protein
VKRSQVSVISAAFLHQQPIPRRFTCDGEDISPELSWHGVPEHTEAFALIMENPDASLGVFTHWTYCDIPGSLRGLPEDVEQVGRPSLGDVQGVNHFGNVGYNGPYPPPGPAHHYHVILYALDGPLRLPPRHSKHELREAMHGHVLAEGDLAGTYRRTR